MAPAIKELIIPTVHLNGTSKSNLMEQLLNAYNALSEAQKRLQEAMPHPRDYYVKKDSNEINLATTQHIHRLIKIDEVMAELMQMAEAIDEKYPSRKP